MNCNFVCRKRRDLQPIRVSKGRGNRERLIYPSFRGKTRTETEHKRKSYHSQPEAFSHIGGTFLNQLPSDDHRASLAEPDASFIGKFTFELPVDNCENNGMRTISKFFRAGFFGGLGVIAAFFGVITAFFVVCLPIFLLLAGFLFLYTVASRSPTPEAALQQHYGSNRIQYQVIEKRKLSDNSENKVAIVYCLENSEGTYMQACVQGQSVPSRSCLVAVQRLGGWEVDQTTNQDNCYRMLQTGRTLD